MINTVTKRDGTVVPFDPSKLNNWGDWASETTEVSWPEVVFNAIRTVSEGVKTTDLHQALIDSCLTYRTEQHTKMAARLLIGAIYKEAFDDFSVPSFVDFYHDMVEQGQWRDMGYSEQDLKTLDYNIDVTRDFTYSYATLKQFYDKYSLKSNDLVCENPQFAFMGIAMSNMSDGRGSIDDVITAYHKISSLKINLPTPTVALERTPMLAAPSCVVISGKDSVDSIAAANHVAYTMTAKSSGIGVELGVRSPKDPVKGGKIAHGGKHGYYSLISRSVQANSQLTRGGSATVTFHVLDPEIDKLLTLKQQRTDPTYKIDTLDYSFSVNNLFLKKVARNEEWMTCSIYNAPKLWELSYSGDEVAFEEEYNKILASNTKKTMFKARDILRQWIKGRGDTGRVYITFLDNMNKHTPFKDPIRLSNLCVAKGTSLLTKAGYVGIETVADTYQTIWNGREWSEAFVAKTNDNAELIKVTVQVSNGSYNEYKVLYCTPYHKWYLRDGKEYRTFQLEKGTPLLAWCDSEDETTINTSEVVSLEPAPSGETYCVNEPLRHMAVFNGILTGNCQEIALPTAGFNKLEDLFTSDYGAEGEVALCSLGAIVVSNIEDDEDYEETAYIVAKIIDNTLESSVYPFPHIEHTAKARRSIGVGITDLAHLMAKKGLMYDTVEGRTFIHKLLERHSFYLYKASNRLAKERGKCNWYHKTKYSDFNSWLPIDTYNKVVDTYCDSKLYKDWEGLREDIKEYGTRFSVVGAFMPTESSSVLTNCTNSCYPIRNKEVFKQSKKGAVYFRAPDMDNLHYQNAYDVDDKDMVKVYSIIQKFTDQGISADFYTKLDDNDARISTRKMTERVLMAAKSGMKTFYYENFKVNKTEVVQEESDCESCKL